MEESQKFLLDKLVEEIKRLENLIMKIHNSLQKQIDEINNKLKEKEMGLS